MIEVVQLHPGEPEHFFRFIAGMVAELADDPFNAAVDDEHSAGTAGGHFAVKCAAVEGDAVAGSLAYGILLRVDGAHAVLRRGTVIMRHLLHKVAHVIAMRQAFWGTDITGNQHLFVAHDHASAAPAVAGSPFGRSMRQFYEVFVPGRAEVVLSGHILGICNISFRIFSTCWFNCSIVPLL